MSDDTPLVSDDLPQSPARVLVADADAAVRELVVGVLGDLGHETRAAADGGDAWRTFEEWLPDLVVLDVNLPIVDGLEICRRIREFDGKREVFVLLMTERSQSGILERALDAGGDEFIKKPMTPEDLRARLVVAKRRMLQDAARRRAEAELSDARWRAGIGDAMLALQHEINNPLSALLGNAELMMMELREQGERNEMLEVIHEQATRIADVVRRLRRLKNPETVDYVGGSRMVDVWNDQ